jgi:SpoVK/Ycf46/Vps4 family AAA+-type ATPase
VKKLYIPLPDYASRMQLLKNTLARPGVDHRITPEEQIAIVQRSAGYSGSDMAALCTEASMGPIRHMSSLMQSDDDISHIDARHVRPIESCDFDAAFKSIRPSVNQKDLAAYVAWNVSHTHGDRRHTQRQRQRQRHTLTRTSSCV